jgi:hypothetical protein
MPLSGAEALCKGASGHHLKVTARRECSSEIGLPMRLSNTPSKPLWRNDTGQDVVINTGTILVVKGHGDCYAHADLIVK